MKHPLGPLQLPYYRAFLKDPTSSAGNRGTALRLREPVDAEALAEAFARCVERHEGFRYVVSEEDGVPVQGTSPGVAAPRLVVEDARALASAALEARAQALLDTPFDLHGEAPVRLVLLRGDAESVLVLVNAHVFCDLGAVDVLFHELGGFYAARVAGEAFEPPAPAPFGPFAAQHDARVRADAGAALARWSSRLAGASTDLRALPERPPVRASEARGAASAVLLGPEAREALDRLRAQTGASTFKLLVAAWAVVVSNGGAQGEVLLGTNVRAAPPEADYSVGTFVNALPLRLGVAADAPFTRVLDEVSREVAHAQQAAFDPPGHAAAAVADGVPFRSLVALGRLRRCPDLTPLFVGAAGVPWRARLGPLEITGALPLRQHGGWLELELLAVDVSGVLAAVLSFDEQTVPARRAGWLLARLGAVLRAVVAAPETPVANLPRLADEEAAWLATVGERPRDFGPYRSVRDRVEEAAARTPDAVALRSGPRRLTYGELDARAARLASVLAARELPAEPRVLVALPRSERVPVAFLAAWKAGAAYVPVDLTYPDDRVKAIVESASAQVAIVDASSRARLAALAPGLTLVDVDADPDAPSPGAPSFGAPLAPSRLAYVIFTSGTTGRPKGVAVEHGGLANYVADVGARWGFGPGDRTLAFASFAFDSSVPDLWGGLAHGATVVVRPDDVRGGKELARLVRESALTHLSLPPAVWRTLERGDDFATVRCGVTCGDAAGADFAERWGGGRKLLNEYGPTEVTVCATSADLAPGRPVTIGRPLANVRTWLLDDERRAVPPGAPGELWVGGAGVARGYVGNDALTAERFAVIEPVPGVAFRAYRTGDLARWSDDGELVFLGRADAQVKVRGYRIELDEVEGALARVPGVAAAAARAVETPHGKALAGYLVVRADASPGDADVRAALARTLPPFMIPTFLVRVDALPLSSNGKVERDRLPPHVDAAAGDGAHAPGEAAGLDVEATVLAAFRETLGRPDVPADASFFDSGGDSLLAVELAALLEERLGREVMVAELFAAPSARAFAERRAGATAPPDDARTPFVVLVPPLDGGPETYARVVGAARGPLHALATATSPGLDAVLAAWGDATASLGRPVVLAGWSEGGKAALVLADRLLARGVAVQGVVLVDTHPLAVAAAASPSAPPASAAGRELDRAYLASAPALPVAFLRAEASPAASVDELARRLRLVVREELPGDHHGVLRDATLVGALERAASRLASLGADARA